MASREGPFDVPIRRVLAQVHPDLELSGSSSSAFVSAFVEDTCSKLVSAAILLASMDTPETSAGIELSVDVLVNAITNRFPGEIGKHSISEGRRSVTRLNSADGSDTRTLAERAGLVFPPDQVTAMLTRLSENRLRAPQTPSVFVAAVLEYLTAELLELSGTRAQTAAVNQVETVHLRDAIIEDEELSLLVIPAVMAERERLFGGHYYAYEFVAEELPPLPPSATPATGKKRRGKKKKGARNTFLEHIRKVKNEQGKSGGNKASSEAAAQDSGDDSAGQQTEPEDDPFSFLKDVGGPAIVFPRNWGDV